MGMRSVAGIQEVVLVLMVFVAVVVAVRVLQEVVGMFMLVPLAHV